MQIQNTVTSNADFLELMVTDVPIEKISSNNKSYVISVSNNSLNLKITILKRIYNTFKKSKASGHGFSFKRNKDDNFYQLRLKINVNKALNNFNNDILSIKYFSKKGITVTGNLLITKEQIENDIERSKQISYQKSKRKAEKQQLKKAKKEREMENARKMAEALNRYESKHKNKLVSDDQKMVNENELVRKKIYLKDSFSKNICENCVYFIGNKCNYHNIRVTNKHSCYKFRAHKILYGGGFSPK